MQRKNNLTVEEAFQQFIKSCRVKNLTEKTITFYQDKIKQFYLFVSEETPIDEITLDVVNEWVLFLKEHNQIKDVTVNSYLRAIRAFLYWCMEYQYIVPNFKIKLIKAEKKVKETYTDVELEILLKKPNMDNCSFSEYKTWVFENYLIATGNRISTALEVKIEDVNFSDGIIVLKRTKNRKQQIIPLSATLARVLKEYLMIRGGNPEDYLFCTDYGTQAKPRTYQDLVQRYNKNRGVEKTSCHLFRHTFAKHWILAGGDIFRLQKILGHSDLTVTREYVNMFGQDLQMDFEKFNPLDRMKKSHEAIKMK